jgi:UDP-N-acetylglucosamine--N-acetylmuramyl-(pentapeptide) pyrophosphoryl-undecaprenol N-acetylglucosamine transferase
MRSSSSKIVITGGGSGGHTVTALAVIDALKKEHPGIEGRILYIGGKKGMEGEKNVSSVEERMAKDAGLDFIGIRSGKLQRRFSLRTLTGLAGVFGGFIDAFSLFRNRDISLVFSTGGYVTVPVCIAAWLKKVPVVIHEQTTRVGLSNKITSRVARKVLIGYPGAEEFLPQKKTVFTGNTVRKELVDPSLWPKGLRVKLRSFKKKSENYPVVLIAGGGQGSHVLNSTALIALKSLASHFHVIIITGDNQVLRDHEKLVSNCRKLSKEHQKRILVTKFASAEELGAYYDVTDVFVGRGGALFTYEVGALSIPSVLIPIPWVTHNEQYHNAKVLEDIGLANILQEGVLSPEILFQEIQRMVTKIRGNRLIIDEQKRSEIFVLDAAEHIAGELKEYL